MSSLWLDVRYAIRMMGKTPGLTAVLAITLALGIGASTTIFSVVHSVLLRPMPYDKPEELVRVYEEVHDNARTELFGLSGPDYVDLARACRSCASLGTWYHRDASLTGGDRPMLARVAFVTHTVLPLLGVKPLLGRWFDASEDPPGEPGAEWSRAYIVLGYDLWKHAFGGDPSVIGRKITHESTPMTVLGVMPPGFDFLDHVEAWIPYGRDLTRFPRGSLSDHVIARLKPGVSIEAFRDELRALAVQWGSEPDQRTSASNPAAPMYPMVARPFHADFVGSLSTTLWLLQGAALLVLLISIVNIANLLLARSEGRTREVAVRHALGASRRRLIRQFVTESLLLGGFGGALGILVATWAVDGVTALIPRSAPRSTEIALDGTAVVFAVACSLAAALLFGLAPILHARRTDLHGALKDGSPRMTGTKARLRARRALVIAEIALAVVLVIGCTVMVRSFVRLQQVDVGFRPDHLLTFDLELRHKKFPGDTPDVFWHRLQDRLRALPGVTGVTLLDELPPSRPLQAGDIRFPGRMQLPGEIWTFDYRQVVGDDFVATLGARLIQGRALLASDTGDAPPACLVNEAFARRFFPDEDPIGKRVEIFGTEPPRPPIYQTIVGVIGDIKQQGLDHPAGTEVYVPTWQYTRIPVPAHGLIVMNVVVRTERDPESSINAVTQAIAELDPVLPVAKLRTMDDILWEAVARPRFLTFLLSCFAGLALVLAAVGIYGVMSHGVALRTHEIGLRVALGAQSASVRRLVLRQAAVLVAAGVAVGVGVAIGLQYILDGSLRDLFYGERLSQPGLLAGVAIVVAVTALLATWIPARRATLIEPTVALRIE
jgi:putative ABC transport system permease protein